MKLAIVGAGRVGTTLGHLFHRCAGLEIGEVFSRDISRAEASCRFIGAGTPVDDLKTLNTAELLMLSVADNAIAPVAQELAEADVPSRFRIAFHCSGGLSSEVLAPLRNCCDSVCSVHPVMTFAAPERSIDAFDGTYCGVEGDVGGTSELTALFERIGGKPFAIHSADKEVYHAAAVMLSNYVTTLIDTGLRCYGRAGVAPEQAKAMAASLAEASLRNALEIGPEAALTGPIARGDDATVERHLAKLEAWDGEVAGLYAALGKATVELSRRKGAADAEALDRIADLLG